MGLPIVPEDACSAFGTKLCPWVRVQDKKYRNGQLDPGQRLRWEEMLRQGGLRKADAPKPKREPSASRAGVAAGKAVQITAKS